MSKYFSVRGESRPTSEHWAPCQPLLCAFKGREYYRATICWVWLDGEGLARSFGEFNTQADALEAAIEAAKTEPKPSRG